MTTAAQPQPIAKTIYLKDYTPPAFLIATVDLDVSIGDGSTVVRSTLVMERNPKAKDQRAPLVLDGDDLELVSIAVDGRKLPATEYSSTSERLEIAKVPEKFTLEVVTKIHPETNTQLCGLYSSSGNMVTQCEAEGFRRITYFLDRPDVMSRYTATIHADKAKFPVLLSNGNLVASGDEANGRHWATWKDPFPKPSYLFAMVAAKLEKLESTFRTKSGRTVTLQIYVEPGQLDKTEHAMQCLKNSLAWDEKVFGLELDLDQFMIVATSDFNMGAMENKGLNIFNSSCVLARPDTATDGDYQTIDGIIAHEYFHNWTGNRVTCRDWFQLSLKEGLTVFRDQEYSADHYSRPVKRIQEVRRLRAAQFPEDAGPMAHPVRPESYIAIDNFYTATVYEKGAEVVRMIHTLIGAQNFRKGMDLYFQRHDGQAVTTDDFVQAMADASAVDLTQFKRWYRQAGTPVIEASSSYDAAKKVFTLTLKQSCPATPGQPSKEPFHIPIAFGLVGADGRDVAGATKILSLTEAQQTFRFADVPPGAIPSIARDFSAPVIVNYPYDEAALTHLMAHDSDAFNRWEAGQRLAAIILLRGIETVRAGGTFTPPSSYLAAFGQILARASEDPAFAAEAMVLPTEAYLTEQVDVADPDAIHSVRRALRVAIAQKFRTQLLDCYREFTTPGTYKADARASGRRGLRNACLGYLMETPDREILTHCVAQFGSANNMTEEMAALAAIANADVEVREGMLGRFALKWHSNPLVMDKWFGVQAMSRLPSALADVKALTKHEAFDMRNPNKVRSLVGAFCFGNQVRFHAADGSGYEFAADWVIALDKTNPQVAARMARALERYKKFDAGRQANARKALERIRGAAQSNDVIEIVSKALA